jgi:plastocyanin
MKVMESSRSAVPVQFKVAGHAVAGVALALALLLEPAVAGAQGDAEGEAPGGQEPVSLAVFDAPVAPESAPEALLLQVAAPAAAPTPAPAVKVTMVDNRNLPGRVTVPVGTTVTWVNAGLLPHTVSAQSGRLESGMVQAGQSYSFTFDTPGEYVYFCRPHVVIGMTGVVVVE